MAAFIVVYEDYTPELFKTEKAMYARFSGFFLDEEHTKPVTPTSIGKKVKQDGAARLYSENSEEWTYKVFAA